MCSLDMPVTLAGMGKANITDGAAIPLPQWYVDELADYMARWCDDPVMLHVKLLRLLAQCWGEALTQPPF